MYLAYLGKKKPQTNLYEFDNKNENFLLSYSE